MELKAKIIHPTVEFGNITIEDIVVDTNRLEDFKKTLKDVLAVLVATAKEAGMTPAPAQDKAAPTQPQKSSQPSHKSESGAGGAREHSGKVCSEVNLKYDKKGKPYVSFRVDHNGKKFGASIWQDAEAIANSLSEGDDVVIYGEITKKDKFYNLFAGKLVSPAIGEDAREGNGESGDDQEIPF
jgi:RecG-like helicase